GRAPVGTNGAAPSVPPLRHGPEGPGPLVPPLSRSQSRAAPRGLALWCLALWCHPAGGSTGPGPSVPPLPRSEPRAGNDQNATVGALVHVAPRRRADDAPGERAPAAAAPLCRDARERSRARAEDARLAFRHEHAHVAARRRATVARV